MFIDVYNIHTLQCSLSHFYLPFNHLVSAKNIMPVKLKISRMFNMCVCGYLQRKKEDMSNGVSDVFVRWSVVPKKLVKL